MSGPRPESESTWRLALDKTVRRLNAALSWSNGRRSDTRLSRPIWDRNVISGDANIMVAKGQRVHIRYEANAVRQHAPAQRLASRSLQLDTRVSFMKNRFSLSPSLNVRRQTGTTPELGAQSARFTLAAQIAMPRRMPGTDLSIYFTTHSIQTAGLAAGRRTELVMRWILKRM